MQSNQYNLTVIGSGPGGRSAAIAAAGMHKRVALVTPQTTARDGLPPNRTVGPKLFRDAIRACPGCSSTGVPEDRGAARSRITMDELQRRLVVLRDRERKAATHRLQHSGVEVLIGAPRFVGPHRIEVRQSRTRRTITSDYVLVATDTVPSRRGHVPFDGKCICDTDEILRLDALPNSLIVVGAGVIGIEYATLFATLGVDVVVVDMRTRLLDAWDQEIVDSLLHVSRARGMGFRLGEEVIGVDRIGADRAAVELADEERLTADVVLFATGHLGDTNTLNLQAAGLDADDRGRLWCHEDQQSWVPHIYGVGDVVGFPQQRVDEREQGLRAVCAAFREPFRADTQRGYELFTIPEIAMLGHSSEQLTDWDVAFEVGVAQLRSSAHGPKDAETGGLLKLFFQRASRQLMGIHCSGDRAAEIVNNARGVMAVAGTIDDLCQEPTNDRSIAESYQAAVADGLNRLAGIPIKRLYSRAEHRSGANRQPTSGAATTR
ncbi:MAG: NAD(P)(+) transhydrogenase [Planctomycetaceae bacterium]|nr:NAD(P)(+) transhydrogenase [Planctomycetaceae bacterium]